MAGLGDELARIRRQLEGTKEKTYRDFATGPELEALFAEIENRERAQAGLEPLPIPETEPDPELEELYAEIDEYLLDLDHEEEEEGEGHA